ncbi:DNA-binding protein [Escherichia coli]|nr:DNA-binding protein [Escherichia coli]
MYELYCMYCVFFIPGIRWRHSLRNRSQTMTSLSPDTVRRIEDAAAALIAAGTPNPTNEQATPLPPELAQLLTGQLGLLWQAAVKQAEAGALAAREQADDDIARADKERDEALANVAALESELAVLREVVAERDRLLQEVRELRAEALPLREQVARLTATGEHLAAQLQDTKAELKEAREDGRQLQTELLALARQDGKVKK